jgi:cytoskeletal protein RodZ
MERTRSDGSVDARLNLAAWLRAGRDRQKLTIEDVAKVTKIQPRILEKLERGELDGLPAVVFVRGFVRSFAKCVGLDEAEALAKYSAAQAQSAAPQPAIAVARALVETMTRKLETPSEAGKPAPAIAGVVEAKAHTIVDADPAVEVAAVIQAAPTVEAAPAVDADLVAAARAVEVAVVVEASSAVEAVAAAAVETAVAAEPKQKRNRKKNRNAAQRQRKKKQQAELAVDTAAGAPTADAMSIAAHPIETGAVAKRDGESVEAANIEAKTSDVLATTCVDGAPSLAEGSQRISQVVDAVEPDREQALATDATVTAAEISASDAGAATSTTGTWRPTMPPIPATPSVPWRRPSLPTSTAYVVPTLVIDDADPDSADREREDRIAKEPHRLSFLPPILLDREDRSARQGGLTLAVIILLIAATLTLSYLMRRPSPSGDGVTMLDGSSMLVAIVG